MGINGSGAGVGSRQIDAYLNVAATFTSASAGEGLSSEALRLMDELLDGSPPLRRLAVGEVVALPVEEREAVVTRLLQRAGAVDASIAIESAAEVAKSDPTLATAFHEAVQTHALRHVLPASVIDIAAVSDAEATLTRLVEEPGIERDVREMANRNSHHSAGLTPDGHPTRLRRQRFGAVG